MTITNAEPRVLRMPGTADIPPYGKVLIPGYETLVETGLPALPARVLQFGLPAIGSGPRSSFRLTAFEASTS